MELIRGISGLDKDIPLGNHKITIKEVLVHPFTISFKIKHDSNDYTGILDGFSGNWNQTKFKTLLEGKTIAVDLLYETLSEFTGEIVAGVVISQEEEENILETIFSMSEIQESLSTLFLYPSYLKYRKQYVPFGFESVEVIDVYSGGILKVCVSTDSEPNYYFISFYNKSLEKKFKSKNFLASKFLLRLLARNEIKINGLILSNQKDQLENSLTNPFPTEIYFEQINLTNMLLILFDEDFEGFRYEYGEAFEFVIKCYEENKDFCQKKVVDVNKPYQSKLVINQTPTFKILITEIVDTVTFKGICFTNNSNISIKIEGVYFPDQSAFSEIKSEIMKKLYDNFISSTFSVTAIEVDSKANIISNANKGTIEIKEFLIKNGYCLLDFKNTNKNYSEIYEHSKANKNGIHKYDFKLIETWNHHDFKHYSKCILSYFMSPSSFYVQSLEDEKELEFLVESCQNTEKISIPDIKKGTLCLALFHEDGLWYRAEVNQNLNSNDLIMVTFIDYGNCENVSKNEIIELPHELYSYPRMCLKICPANLLFPKKGHELYDWVFDKVSSELEQKDFQIELVEKNQVLLFKGDYLLNTLFLREGYCRLINENKFSVWMEDLIYARKSAKGIWTCHDSLEEEVNGHAEPLDFISNI